MLSAASLAPPCAGPHRQATPAAIAANGLVPDEPHRRTVEVDAFCSWSACRMKMRSSARTSTSLALYSSHGVANIMRMKFAGVRQVVLRVHVRLADRVLVGHRHQRRHLGDQADRRDLAVLRVVDVECSRDRRPTARRPGRSCTAIGCASRRKPRRKNCICSLTIVWLVTSSTNSLLLRRVRQLAVQQQVAGLEEVAVARRAARSGSRGTAARPCRRRCR